MEDSDAARALRPLHRGSCVYRIALGPRAGQKVLTLQGALPREVSDPQKRCANSQGFSLYAAVRCGAGQRETLERLCRFITRPALANDRVQINSAGRRAEAQDPVARRYDPSGDVALGVQVATGGVGYRDQGSI